MNWLGRLVQRQISRSDTVLDLGCGIFQATTNSITGSWRGILNALGGGSDNLVCKSLLGVEVVDEYIEVAKRFFPVIKMDVSRVENLAIFADKSFDVVMALDVVEHLEYSTALELIERMRDIARKKVIVYTPREFETNEEHTKDVWGIKGVFETQRHRSLIRPETFINMGFEVSYAGPERNTLAIWSTKQ